MSKTKLHTDNKRSSIIAGYSAISIGVFLISIKAYAYYMSGALSILSSLTDSVLDSFISIVALSSVYYARRPADSDHRWGHGKMEAVSALFQAAMIAGGGVFLVFEAVGRLAHPREMAHFQTGMVVMAISIVMSAGLVWMQRRSLKECDSLAIEADSLHYSSDILINAGAMAVLFLTMQGAPSWVDALFAIAVAGFMGVIARNIAHKSLDMLLDRELPEEERQVIKDIIGAHKQVLGWHDLRTHNNGSNAVIIVDIEADASLSLFDAHAITSDLEKSILQQFPKADILIHVDPEGDKSDARHKVKGVHI